MKRALGNEQITINLWTEDVVRCVLQRLRGNRIEKMEDYPWLLELKTVAYAFKLGVISFLESDLLFLAPSIIKKMKVGGMMVMRAINEVKLPFGCRPWVPNYLIGLGNLQILDISCTRAIDVTLLTQMTNLTSLVSDKFIGGDAIKQLTQLKSLSTNNHIDDECLQQLVNLTYLNLGSISDGSAYAINDAGLSCLTNLTKLVNNKACLNPFRINLSKSLPNLTCYVENATIGLRLDGMTNLKRLELGSPICMTDITPLINLEELVSICSKELVINDDIKNLTNLRVLDIQRKSDLIGDSLEKLTNLEYLSLYKNSNIYDSDLYGLTKLNYLSLEGCCNITNAPLYRMTRINNISVDC